VPRPTLEAVAERAGVGRGTVSRVINGSPSVSEKARAAVEQAIAELGYVPNRAARALVTSRTDSVAVVVPETETRLFSEPYFSEIIRGAVAELSDADMQALLILVRTERERVRLADYLASQRVDGVLLVSVHGGDPLPGMLEEIGMPTVLGGRRDDEETLSCVHADNLGGAEEAVRHLVARGCRVIGTVTGDLDQEGARARVDGWRRTLLAAGLEAGDDLVATADFSEEQGERAILELLDRRPDMDGVFVANDLMAAGAIRVLRGSGRRVPDDVAVVGFDDSFIARHTDPPLTSVRQPTEEMGRTMARLLMDEIAEPGRPRRHLILGTELVRRGSA